MLQSALRQATRQQASRRVAIRQQVTGKQAEMQHVVPRTKRPGDLSSGGSFVQGDICPFTAYDNACFCMKYNEIIFLLHVLVSLIIHANISLNGNLEDYYTLVIQYIITAALANTQQSHDLTLMLLILKCSTKCASYS